jgi:short-subunit dehydrogenase
MSLHEFSSRYGPWAVIAGASVGIGAEFARQLASRGLNLVLVARRPEPLRDLSARLQQAYGHEVRSLELDLGAPDLATEIREGTGDLEVGLLVYNAALSSIGPFLDQDLESQLAIIDVNCRGPLILAHELGRRMADRRRGGILLMSSLSGLQGSPYISTYAATKAYNLVLGEGLWYELRERGVDVLAFCAGATRTPGYEESRPRSGRFLSAPVMETEPVVSHALAALGRRPSGVAGWVNRLAGIVMSRLLPRRIAVATMGRTTRAMYLP